LRRSPLGGYNYITPRHAGLSATAGLSCGIYSNKPIIGCGPMIWHTFP